MLNVSEAYKTNISSYMREFDICITIGEQVIGSQYIKSIKVEEKSCSGEILTLGDVCSHYVEIEFFHLEDMISFQNAQVKVECGLKTVNGYEYVSLGIYRIDNVVKNQSTVKLSGYDAMQSLNDELVLTEAFIEESTFENALNMIVDKLGVELVAHDFSDYLQVAIENIYEGMTYKELLGQLSGLMGCLARINRLNQLEFYWYEDCGMIIDDSMIYQDGYQENGEMITVMLPDYHDDALDFTNITGVGMSFSNPYMTKEFYEKIYTKIHGMTYQPCTLKWRGHPEIEVCDMVTYGHKKIMMMNQTFIFDGGLSQEIECLGKTEEKLITNSYTPLDIKLTKMYHTLNSALKESGELILGHKGGNFVIDCNDDQLPCGWKIMDTPVLESYSKYWQMNQAGLVFVDGGRAKTALDFQGRLVANIMTTGTLHGEKFQLDLDEGELKIGERVDGEIVDPVFHYDKDGHLIIKNIEDMKNSSYVNLIKDSCGCFKDGSWLGDYYLLSSSDIQNRNLYGYAIGLAKGSLTQTVKVNKGKYTLSFQCLDYIDNAQYSLKVNHVVFSKEQLTAQNLFTYTFEINSENEIDRNITIEWNSDTDQSCAIVNLMLNAGEVVYEWSLNPNEVWSDSVKIGRGVRISSIGSEVDFVAYANRIGFVDNENQFVTTYDHKGMNTKEIAVTNQATILRLFHQTINNQIVVNVLSEEEI